MIVETIVEASGKKTGVTTFQSTSFDNMVAAAKAEGYAVTHHHQTRVGRMWRGKKTTWRGIEIIVTHIESEDEE